MNKLLFFVLMLVMTSNVSFAQDAKERKEIMKLSKAELNAKATKAARQEAKKLQKEGWMAPPGALPLEKQLDRAYLMQMEYDDNGFPKYILGEAMSIGGNYDAAKMQALELAKQNLAGKIQTEVTALIENSVDNKQLDAEDAVSATESISRGINSITQSIGRVIPVVELYRILKNKNKEIRVQIAYSSELAQEATKKAIRQDLEAKGDKLREKLDKALGW